MSARSLKQTDTLQKTAGGAALTFVTLTGSGQAITIPTGAVAGLALVQDATGGRTATWPTGIRWDGGTVPTLATGGNATDVFTFVALSDGGWLGSKTGTHAGPDTVAPTAPTALTAGTPTGTTVPLSWTASTDNVGVAGYEYSTNGTTWISTGSTGTTYTVTGLKGSTAYTIQLRAFDATGNRSTAASVNATTAIPAGDYNPVVMADAPFYYLPLDDTAGTTAPRTIGSDATAWSASSVTFGAAGIGDGATSASYDGTASLITGPVNGLNAAAAWSAEVIINMTNLTANKDLVGAGIGSWHMVLNGNKVRIGMANTAGTYLVNTTSLLVNTRYHLAVTYDGANLKLYINGVLDSTLAKTGSVASTTTATKIGFNGQGHPAGKIAGVAVYKTALSASRVLTHAQAAGLA